MVKKSSISLNLVATKLDLELVTVTTSKTYSPKIKSPKVNQLANNWFIKKLVKDINWSKKVNEATSNSVYVQVRFNEQSHTAGIAFQLKYYEWD